VSNRSRLARFGLNIAALIAISATGTAQQWYWIPSPICARLKIKGSKLANRHFTIYAAQSKDSECCSGSPVRTGNLENDDVQFKLQDLQSGLYFAVFELRDGRLVVPLEVKRRGASGTCGSESTVIKANHKTGKISVETFVSVD